MSDAFTERIKALHQVQIEKLSELTAMFMAEPPPMVVASAITLATPGTKEAEALIAIALQAIATCTALLERHAGQTGEFWRTELFNGMLALSREDCS